MVKVTRFTADWCVPCKSYGPVLEEVLAEFPEVEYEVIDIEDDRSAVVDYRISSIPLTVTSVDGVEVDRFTGVRFKSQIASGIRSALS